MHETSLSFAGTNKDKLAAGPVRPATRSVSLRGGQSFWSISDFSRRTALRSEL